MNHSSYDAIVLGIGGMGSAAAYHLARRGARVLGLDRFPPAHDHGSSHGQTRIIRHAYCEHPDYVPLVQHAHRLWLELEQQVGQTLLEPVGLIEVGPADGYVVPGVLRAAREHDLAVEEITAGEARRRFPNFHIPETAAVVFEPTAGYLLVEDCIVAHCRQAREHGAELRAGMAVTGWQAEGNSVRVQTDQGVFSAAHLVITAGAWSSQVLAELGLPLTVLRKHLYWYDDPQGAYTRHSGCPTFLFEQPDGIYYGFPSRDGKGVKVAEHSGGEPIDDPLGMQRSIDAADRDRVARFVEGRMPRLSRRILDHSLCMYTKTPDGHFIVDRHPAHRQVVFIAGLSGHGFKFASAFGRAVAELCLDGRTDLPLDFLALQRPSLFA